MNPGWIPEQGMKTEGTLSVMRVRKENLVRSETFVRIGICDQIETMPGPPTVNIFGLLRDRSAQNEIMDGPLLSMSTEDETKRIPLTGVRVLAQVGMLHHQHPHLLSTLNEQP